jgi:nicotinamidase/pyrazinamidase
VIKSENRLFATRTKRRFGYDFRCVHSLTDVFNGTISSFGGFDMDLPEIQHRQTALIVVDVQNDFCGGGTMAVPGSDAIISIVNRLIPEFGTHVFTRDWHPADHMSFSAEPEFIDGSWPAHCVIDTQGAMFHRELVIPENAFIINKGTLRDREAYSGFQDTDLAAILRKKSIQHVFVTGLATDYCVKHTALDALNHNFDVSLIQDAVRGVDIPAGSADMAVREMESRGVHLTDSERFLIL